MNKFLKQYPKLWFPKVGDKIRIIKVLNNYRVETDNWTYEIGDTGTIIHLLYDDEKLNTLIVKLDDHLVNDHIFPEECELWFGSSK